MDRNLLFGKIEILSQNPHFTEYLRRILISRQNLINAYYFAGDDNAFVINIRLIGFQVVIFGNVYSILTTTFDRFNNWVRVPWTIWRKHCFVIRVRDLIQVKWHLK